jgi:hypothetical protein
VERDRLMHITHMELSSISMHIIEQKIEILTMKESNAYDKLLNTHVFKESNDFIYPYVTKEIVYFRICLNLLEQQMLQNPELFDEDTRNFLHLRNKYELLYMKYLVWKSMLNNQAVHWWEMAEKWIRTTVSRLFVIIILLLLLLLFYFFY